LPVLRWYAAIILDRPIGWGGGALCELLAAPLTLSAMVGMLMLGKLDALLLPHHAIAIAVLYPLLFATFCHGFRNRRLKAQRLSTNECEVCGYDLRATRDRCTKCGTPIKSAGNPITR
jgi:hypothetical protein